MLRICIGLGAMFLFTGCEKYWRGFHIEKRIYRDGYYVHLPWKRNTPKNEYPKPDPYPVDYSQTAATDTTQKNAGSVVDSVNQSGDGRREAGATVSTQTSVGSGGVSAPSQGSVGQGGGIGTYGNPPSSGYANAPPSQGTGTPGTTPSNYSSLPSTSPTVTYAPPPILQPEDITDPVLQSSQDSLPPDSAIVVKDSTITPTDSVAIEQGWSFPDGEFSLYAEIGLYNSVAASSYSVKPQSYNAGVGLRYAIQPWSRHKISADAGIFSSGISIRQDQRKANPLFNERHDKERISQLKMRFMLMDHLYITRNGSANVDAVEFGVFSEVGFFSTHVAIDQHGTDEKAAMTRSKTRLIELKYLRTFQYGITLRIANEKWSVFANYRINSLLRASSNGGDLPRLVIGSSFLLNL